MTIGAIDAAATIAIAMFLAGVIYQAGRLSVRVEQLEGWRDEHERTHRDVVASLQRLENLIRGEET